MAHRAEAAIAEWAERSSSRKWLHRLRYCSAPGCCCRPSAVSRRSLPGFDANNATTFRVVAPPARYATAGEMNRYYDNATAALRAIPGVTEVSTGTMIPFSWRGRAFDTYVQLEKGDQGTNNPQAEVAVVAPGYERALGLPVLRGRTFAISDDSASERVVVINEALARAYYPGTDPIGRTIQWNFGQWRIVGVVGSTHLASPSDTTKPVLYATPHQMPRRARYFIVRSIAPAIRSSQRRDRRSVASIRPSH